MRAEEVAKTFATPLTAPPYPLVSNRFIDREYLNIAYRTDQEALRAVVPEPLEIEDPMVRFEVMNMGDVGSFGPYVEVGIAIPVVHDGVEGEYLHAMYLDNFGATVAGRELSAFPKNMGETSLRVQDSVLIGTLDVAGERVATATMGYKQKRLDEAEARAQIDVNQFMVKAVRGYDGHMMACDLIRAGVTDLVIKEAWTGPARLQLFEHVGAPLADLPVREVVSASHIITDLTLTRMTKVHDYLEESR